MKVNAMNAIIKRSLLVIVSLLCIRCMCYCPLAYDPRFSFYAESDLLDFSINQIKPIIIDINGDTLRLSSSYSIHDNKTHVYWVYDFASSIENQVIVSALELKDKNDSTITITVMDTFNFSTDWSYSYYAYARREAEQGYTYEHRFSLASITGNDTDTLFISKSPSIENEK